MTSDVFMFFSDYTYYETLGPQQPSVQWQISCIKNLVTHPSDVAPPAYDWNDVAVSTAKKRRKSLFVCLKKGENVEKGAFFLLCCSFSSSLGLRSSLMSPWLTRKMNRLTSTQSCHRRGTAKVRRLNTLLEQFSGT